MTHYYIILHGTSAKIIHFPNQFRPFWPKTRKILILLLQLTKIVMKIRIFTPFSLRYLRPNSAEAEKNRFSANQLCWSYSMS